MFVIEIYTRGILARSVAAGWWLIWAHQESLHPADLPLSYSASFSSLSLSFVSAVHAQQKRSFPRFPAFSRSVLGAFVLFFFPLLSTLFLVIVSLVWSALLTLGIWGLKHCWGVLSLLPRPFLFFFTNFSFFFHDKSNQLASFIIFILI
jgi:hypothetical protein